MGVAEADADVVGVHKGNSRGVITQVDHLNYVVGGPADQEQGDNHQHHLGGPLRPHRLLTFDPSDGAEHMVEGERVKSADDNKWDDEAQNRLVQSVPVHVFRPVKVHHAHLQMLSTHNLGVHHDRHSEEEAAQPYKQIDDDGPLDGPPL